MEKAGIPMRPSTEFNDILAAPSASELDELAERSESLEQRIVSLNDSYETLKKREVELTEWRWVLREAGGFFDRVRVPHSLSQAHWLAFHELTFVVGAWPGG
jgi:V-type H+-transporting ATPase subunit a